MEHSGVTTREDGKDGDEDQDRASELRSGAEDREMCGVLSALFSALFSVLLLRLQSGG